MKQGARSNTLAYRGFSALEWRDIQPRNLTRCVDFWWKVYPAFCCQKGLAAHSSGEDQHNPRWQHRDLRILTTMMSLLTVVVILRHRAYGHSALLSQDACAVLTQICTRGCMAFTIVHHAFVVISLFWSEREFFPVWIRKSFRIAQPRRRARQPEPALSKPATRSRQFEHCTGNGLPHFLMWRSWNIESF